MIKHMVAANEPLIRQNPFTDNERRLAQREMEMFGEVGRLPRTAPVENFFAV
jgi:hypothetical protein